MQLEKPNVSPGKFIVSVAKEHRSLTEFMIKVIVVTICVGWLLSNFYPRYQFVDEQTRFDTITGHIDKKHPWNSNWP